jgi:hypothetical protein
MTMLTRLILVAIVATQSVLAKYCDIYEIDYLPENISNHTETYSYLQPQWICEKSDEAKSYIVTYEDFDALNVQVPISGTIRLKFQEKETSQSLNIVTEETSTGVSSTSGVTSSYLFLSQIADTKTITVESLDTSNRRLALRTGDRNVLIVRATDMYDHSPTRTASQLASDWFGTSGSNAISPKTVLNDCSAGKLTLINAGVIELVVNIDFSGKSSSTVENTIRDQLISSNGANFESNYDHIVYILPSVVDFGGAAAYAYLNGRRSVFSDLNGSYPVVQVHELGHNYDFHHSGKESSYDDPTCLMGNSQDIGWNFERGKMCFNAAKSYHSDWYNDRRTSFDAVVNPFEGTLWGVANYPNDGIPHENYVTVQIRGPTRTFYMTFNRQAGINSDAIAGKNQVTIVSTADTSRNVESKLEAMLSEDEKFVFGNFSNGKALIIEVCRILENERAQVIAYVEDTTFASCMPTNSPSPTISSAPTFGCKSEESWITLEILTDLFPSETSWEVKMKPGAILHSGPSVTMLPEKLYTFDFCLQHGHIYEVVVNDTFGDGLQFNGVRGYYKVMKDHVQIVNGVDNGTDFGRMAVVEIDLSLLTDPPTQLPSKTPSVFPTTMPSSTPSIPSLSINPTSNPTQIESEIPSVTPSMHPTSLTTASRSSSPTNRSSSSSPSKTVVPSWKKSTRPSMSPSNEPSQIPDILCTSDESLITLEILTDDYPAETSWVVKRQSSTVIDSGGPLTDRRTVYTFDFCLQHGHIYEVIVNDEFGDGLRFNGIQGYYKVMKDHVQIANGVDNGTDFGRMAVVEIDLSLLTNPPTQSSVQNHCLLINKKRKCRRTAGCSWSRGSCS